MKLTAQAEQMIRQFMAAIIAAVCIAATGASAQASYRIETVFWGNDDVAKDRIYVRDASTGKRMVLSRHWGSRCKRRAALNYGLGGGCWYPVKESYSTWRKNPSGWVSLGHKRRRKAVAHRSDDGLLGAIRVFLPSI